MCRYNYCYNYNICFNTFVCVSNAVSGTSRKDSYTIRRKHKKKQIIQLMIHIFIEVMDLD